MNCKRHGDIGVQTLTIDIYKQATYVFCLYCLLDLLKESGTEYVRIPKGE